MRLGIDFGTTRTVVATALDGRYPVVAFDVDGDYRDYLPGLAARRDDQWRFGWDAAALAGDAELSLRSLKRAISGLEPDDPVPGTDTGALELTTAYARHLRDWLVDRSNLELTAREPLEATIAVPANASTRQRYLTIEAFTRAGFEVVDLLNEPTAAAVEFAQHNRRAIAARSPKRYVVVYDLGGGTFDTSAVSLEEQRFELLWTEGIGRLGGDDFDEVLLALALDTAGIAADALDPTERTRALELCREAKESLGRGTRKLLVDLSPALADVDPVVVATAELYTRCQPLIDRSLALLGDVFARLPEHGIDPDEPRELGGVYLVGGAVHFPPVATALRARYGRKILLAPQPQAATAVGLAVCGDPGAGVFVREAVTRHFGVWREAEAGHAKVFDPILSKDTAPAGDAPVVVHRVYHPDHTVGALRFMECTTLTGDGQPAGDLTPWTRVLFPYDPALAERGDLESVPVRRTADVAAEEIAETYTYAADGTIAVDIENRTHGYHRHYVLGQLR